MCHDTYSFSIFNTQKLYLFKRLIKHNITVMYRVKSVKQNLLINFKKKILR